MSQMPSLSLSGPSAPTPACAGAATRTATATRADLGLFIVADGMGGHVAGEVASRVAVEAIQAFIDETAGADKQPHLAVSLRTRAQPRRQSPQGGVPPRQPPDRRRDGRLDRPARHGDDGLGGAGRQPRPACVAHVGDSRVYVPARRQRSQQVTHDHSWVEEQVRAGTMSPSAARQHPWRNVVTRALSGGEDPEVDVTELAAAAGRALSALLGRAVRGRRRQRRSPQILGDTDALAAGHLRARSSTRPTRAAAPTTSRSLVSKSMLHNLARLAALPRPDSEPGRARAEGALSRIGARVLLVVHQSAAAAADLHVRLQVRPAARRREPASHYALFMFCGILPWTWFSSSLTESSGVLISGGNLIKKVLFPAEILPIVTVLGEHGALLPRAADPASGS